MICRIGGNRARPALGGLRQHPRETCRLEDLREVRNVVGTLLGEMAALDALGGLRRQLVVIASAVAKLEVSQVLLDIRVLGIFGIAAQVEVRHAHFSVPHEPIIIRVCALVILSGTISNLQGLLGVNLHGRVRAGRPVTSIYHRGADLAGIGGMVLALLDRAFKLPWLLDDCVPGVQRWSHREVR